LDAWDLRGANDKRAHAARSIDWAHFIGKACVDPNSDFPALANRVRFVLVAPSHPGNIGAAARAVKAMGFARLVVVQPRVADFRNDAEAVALSVGAVDILTATTDHADLTAALAGVTRAYAMTGYTREFGPPLIDLRSACVEAGSHLRTEEYGPQVAFVFGTERSGLTNEEVARCHASCAIPADPAFASLNLAQAVQVVAYETRLALSAAPLTNRFESEPPAGVEALEGMYAHLEQALVELGYLDPDVPRKLLSRVRRLLARAHPTASEVDILRGICAAIIKRKNERAGSKSPARQRG
jgi:tRNA/rRNA methyltransferase